MEYLNDYIRTVLLVSFPQAIAGVGFALAIWKLNPSRPLLRLLLYSAAVSLLIDLDFYYVSGEVHVLNALVLTIAFLYLFFRELGYKNLLLVLFTYYIVVMIVEISAAYLSQLIYGWTDAKTMMTGPLFYAAWAILFPMYGILFAASCYVKRRRLSAFAIAYKYLTGLRQTHMKRLLLLAFFQAVGLTLLFVLWNNKPRANTITFSNTLLYLIMTLTFAAFFYTFWLLTRTRDDAVRMTQDVYVEEISKMFTSLRGQRHDFLNHVQVMHTMLQMNKIEQLRSYLSDFVNETDLAGEIPAYDTPALAAFVQAKTAVALSRDIRFLCEAPQQLRIESSVKSVDLIKMLGNLVDNAFDEVESLAPSEREVFLQIRTGEGELEISVHNRGRILNPEDLALICQPGYTTKPDGHSGLGLAIVLERVEHYRGKLHMTSDEYCGTVFRIVLPHEGERAA